MSKLFLGGLRRVVHFLLLVAVGVLTFLGLVVIVDLYQPARLPAIKTLSAAERVAILCQHPALGDDADPWDRMQPALHLLDRACPAVSAWVRDRHDCGCLKWQMDESVNYNACYWAAPRIVVVSIHGLREDPIGLANTLAHEFRHSRQGYLRQVQCAVGIVLGVDRTDELIEREAYDFGAQVQAAILGH